MKNILNQLDTLILIVNSSGLIEFANQAAIKYFNLSSDILPTQAVNQLLTLTLNDLTLYTEAESSTLTDTLNTFPHPTSSIHVTKQLWEGQACFLLNIKPALHEQTVLSPLDTLHQLPKYVSHDKLLHTYALTANYNTMLEQLKPTILTELKGAHVGFWLCDKTHHCLRFIPSSYSYLRCETFPTIIPLTNDVISTFSQLAHLNKIVPVSERPDAKHFTFAQGKKVTFAASYEIRLAPHMPFLGLINVLYTTPEAPPANHDYVIRSLCTQLALLIQNNQLGLDMKQESSKREKIEKEFETLITNTSDLIAIVDSHTGQFFHANSKWQNLLGWSPDELLQGMHLFDFDDFSFLNKIDVVQGYVTEFYCKNGEIKLLECNYKKIMGEALAIFTATDCTEQEMLKEQKKALEDTVRFESLRTEFFATVSHELRTPLNIILATLQLQGTETKYTATIKQNAYRLLKLINNIIDMTKINDGYFKPKLANYNIVSLVESITESTISYMHSKEIDFTFDTDIEEAYIACDPDLIERILLNLLSNSIKYSRDSIQSMIYVTISLEENFVTIAISDNGIGIPKDQLTAIFDRFVQVDTTFSRKREGSGIGLSLVKSLVEMHQGTISVESHLGEGSTFLIKLPRILLPEQPLYDDSERLQNASINPCTIEFSDIRL